MLMARKESVNIEVFPGDFPNTKIFHMSLDISGLDLYERAKATRKFINSDTKVLEMVIETNLREFLRGNGIIPQDGKESSLKLAFQELHKKGKRVDVIDRYLDLENEKIVGESANHMTVILEDNILSCAMEMIIYE